MIRRSKLSKFWVKREIVSLPSVNEGDWPLEIMNGTFLFITWSTFRVVRDALWLCLLSLAKASADSLLAVHTLGSWFSFHWQILKEKEGKQASLWEAVYSVLIRSLRYQAPFSFALEGLHCVVPSGLGKLHSVSCCFPSFPLSIRTESCLAVPPLPRLGKLKWVIF